MPALQPHFTSPLTCSCSYPGAFQVFFLFSKHTKLTPTSGPLHLLLSA